MCHLYWSRGCVLYHWRQMEAILPSKSRRTSKVNKFLGRSFMWKKGRPIQLVYMERFGETFWFAVIHKMMHCVLTTEIFVDVMFMHFITLMLIFEKMETQTYGQYTGRIWNEHQYANWKGITWIGSYIPNGSCNLKAFYKYYINTIHPKKIIVIRKPNKLLVFQILVFIYNYHYHT